MNSTESLHVSGINDVNESKNLAQELYDDDQDE